VSVGESLIGVLGSVLRTGTKYDTTQILAWSTWASPSSLSAQLVSRADLGATGGGAVDIATSGERLYLQTISPDALISYDVKSSAVTLSDAVGEHPTGVDTGTAAIYAKDTTGILVENGAGTYTIPVRPETGRFLTWFRVDRTNAGAFVWIESDQVDVSYTNPTIWTSPFSVTPGGIARRKVARFSETDESGGYGMVANAGATLVLTGDSTALLTRLSDGRGWTIRADTGLGFALPLWVDEAEVWLATADPKLPSFKAYPSGIMRLRRDTLGAPDVSPGF
jgi:hypothetical protein